MILLLFLVIVALKANGEVLAGDDRALGGLAVFSAAAAVFAWSFLYFWTRQSRWVPPKQRREARRQADCALPAILFVSVAGLCWLGTRSSASPYCLDDGEAPIDYCRSNRLSTNRFVGAAAYGPGTRYASAATPEYAADIEIKPWRADLRVVGLAFAALVLVIASAQVSRFFTSLGGGDAVCERVLVLSVASLASLVVMGVPLRGGVMIILGAYSAWRLLWYSSVLLPRFAQRMLVESFLVLRLAALAAWCSIRIVGGVVRHATLVLCHTGPVPLVWRLGAVGVLASCLTPVAVLRLWAVPLLCFGPWLVLEIYAASQMPLKRRRSRWTARFGALGDALGSFWARTRCLLVDTLVVFVLPVVGAWPSSSARTWRSPRQWASDAGLHFSRHSPAYV